jgi:hypothetical protein
MSLAVQLALMPVAKFSVSKRMSPCVPPLELLTTTNEGPKMLHLGYVSEISTHS